jgi:hypothetical protein
VLTIAALTGEPLDLAIIDATMWICTYDIRSFYITAATSRLFEHGVFMWITRYLSAELWLTGLVTNKTYHYHE